jgi:cyclin-dependent kinase 8/11
MDISVIERPRAALRQKYDRGANEKSLGEGTFGRVTKGSVINKHDGTTQTNNHVAIKEFKNDGMLSIDRCREISLLKDLSHPNVVKLKDIILEYTENKKYVYSLIFEYADYDLLTLIKNQKEALKAFKHHNSQPQFDQHNKPLQNSPSPRWLTAAIYKSFLFQLLNGIHYLHSNWIIHRDLKPANILVVDNPDIERGSIKIADFGLARIFKAPLRPLADNGVVVTIWYRAPELLLNSKHYTRAVDIWAIGCIFAEMVLLNPLFPELESSNPRSFQQKQVEKVYSILGTLTPEKWPDVVFTQEYKNVKDLPIQPNRLHEVVPNNKEQAKKRDIEYLSALGFELLSLLLEYNPSKRITALQALEHKYFKEDPLPYSNPLLNIPREILANLKTNYG